MDILYLKPDGNVCIELQNICEQLSKPGPYSLIDLHSYLPSDSLKKYHIIIKFKAGLSVSALLLIYSSGIIVEICISFGMYQIIALIKLKNSQMVIEEIKNKFQFITQGLWFKNLFKRLGG